MDGEAEFARLLKSMEDEVLALKTAHQRPLGALDFFTKEVTLPITLTDQYGIGSYVANFWVDVKVIESEVKPPIVQVGWDIPEGFMNVELYDNTVSADYTTFSYKCSLSSLTLTSAQFKVSALSSMPIESITTRSA